MTTTAVSAIDLGTLDRDRQGRFVKVFTLSYETRSQSSGETIKVVRHLPATGIETVGKVLAKAPEDIAWNIQVLDGDEDVTFDFECFQD